MFQKYEGFLEKVVHLFGSICKKNVDKNRAKRFLENSSFLVRVAIYFLVPREEFKTEKISLPKAKPFFIHKNELGQAGPSWAKLGQVGPSIALYSFMSMKKQ